MKPLVLITLMSGCLSDSCKGPELQFMNTAWITQDSIDKILPVQSVV